MGNLSCDVCGVEWTSHPSIKMNCTEIKALRAQVARLEEQVTSQEWLINSIPNANQWERAKKAEAKVDRLLGALETILEFAEEGHVCGMIRNLLEAEGER